MNKHIKIISIVSISLMFVFSACIKYKFDEPEKTLYQSNLQETHTIQELKGLYTGKLTLIENDVIIKGTVIANDKSGNFYKNIMIQDSTTGLQISLDAYELHNWYHEGDLVYVKCKGLYLGTSGGEVILGSKYYDKVGRIPEPLINLYLFKSEGGKPIKPKALTFPVNINLVNQLVVLKDVQFKRYNVGDTYGNVVLKEDKNTYIEDCSGNTIIVRSSGYADFAGDAVPEGKGRITAILTKYNSTLQLKIRNINEVVMNEPRCGSFFLEEFEGYNNYDPINQFGWSSYDVTGSEQHWAVGEYSNNKFAKITGWDGSSSNLNEDWLISPKFDFTGFSDIQFSFKNACSNHNGPNIQTYVSTDYNGTGNPNDFSWTELTGLNLSSGSYNWKTASKNLNDYANNASVYIGFKYTSTASSSKTWEIDDVKIEVE